MFGVGRLIVVLMLIGMHFPVLSHEQPDKGKLTHYALYYPPYWEESDARITGLHARLSRKLYDQAGIDIDIKSVPYARIHQNLFTDNVAVVAYGANPLTDDRYLFPIPQTTIELKIYSLNAEPVTSLEKLVGRDVAIKRGFPLGGYEVIREDKKYLTVSTNTVEQAIRLLLLRRVDYIVTLDDPFQKVVKKINLNGRKIHSHTLEKLDGWPIAVVKSHPRSETLFKQIKQAYEALRAAGVVTYKNQRLLLTEDF